MADSWRLKVDRAEQHLQEFKAAIDGYAQSHPYEAVRIVRGAKCHEHANCWRYRLHMTQPDATLSIICGDVLYNLRSALDHLAVAMVAKGRRYNASFPVVSENIWAKQNRRYIVHNPERRRSFRIAVAGMPVEAVTAIKSIQPYQMGNLAKVAVLYQLNSLNNADKHRQLIAFARGLKDAKVAITVRGVPLPGYDLESPFVQNDAMVAHGGRDGYPVTPEAEMNVQIDGTPVIAVKVVELDGNRGTGYMDVLHLFDTVIPWLRNQVFPFMEKYARRP